MYSNIPKDLITYWGEHPKLMLEPMGNHPKMKMNFFMSTTRKWMHEVGSFKLKVAINICPWLDEFLSV
jgi:hypothetical protein